MRPINQSDDATRCFGRTAVIFTVVFSAIIIHVFCRLQHARLSRRHGIVYLAYTITRLVLVFLVSFPCRSTCAWLAPESDLIAIYLEGKKINVPAKTASHSLQYIPEVFDLH